PALVRAGHADDLDLVLDLERRDGPFGGAGGRERELEWLFQVVVPAHGPLALVVAIDDDLHCDAVLALRVALRPGLRHRTPPADEEMTLRDGPPTWTAVEALGILALAVRRDYLGLS